MVTVRSESEVERVARLADQLGEACATMEQLQAELAGLRGSPHRREVKAPKVDPVRFAVVYGGEVCELGNGLPWQVFCALARRPDQYVSRETLASAWDGCASDRAITATVHRLRGALRGAGMTDLAEAIDGAEPGYYRLRACWRGDPHVAGPSANVTTARPPRDHRPAEWG
ncbi:MAG: hypothetical protein GY842_13860 [bacterium]|nr:hypothetical protein [bacterium]